jgi:hypothetical protein
MRVLLEQMAIVAWRRKYVMARYYQWRNSG